MITYGVLINRILRVLRDVDQAKFDDDLIYDAVVAAHDAILTWVPNFGKAILTAGSAGDDFILPDDVYVVDSVQTVGSGLFIPKNILSPGTVRGQYTASNDWSDYPRGHLTLSAPLNEGDQIIIYYRSVWSKPANASDTAFVIQPPTYAHNGMVYYAGAHCLVPESISGANLNQFKMRPELGDPTDNALEIMSDFLMKRFFAEMKMMPPFVRAGGP